MTKELIDNIAKLNSSSPKKIVINGRFECTFVVPSLKEHEKYVFFSEAFKEANSSRLQQFADVFVHDNQTNENYEYSELQISNDYDTGVKSLTLYIGIKNSDGNKVILSMHTVIDAVIEDTEDLVERDSYCSGKDSVVDVKDKERCNNDMSKDTNTTACKTETSSLEKETIADCKLLYCNAGLPMTKTCICFGWECGEGWWQVLRRLSCELEALNLLVYNKWKVRIQADQVKQKFGILCFYYSVKCDNYNEVGLAAKKIIDDFESKKDCGYFGLKAVVDERGHTTTEVDDDGKKHNVWHPPKCHVEVTKHKDEYEQMKKSVDEAHKTLCERGYDNITQEQKIMMEWLESEAEKRVRQAEADCYNTCEKCGNQIGTDQSPRCETTGWINYLCDECAAKHNNFYFKNGAKWQGNKMIMTREEVNAERKKYEEKYEAQLRKSTEDNNEEN